MSGAPRPMGSAAPAPKTRHPKLSPEDQRELDLLHATVEGIGSSSSIPPVPYILSTPSMTPYRHYSRQEAEAFLMGGLFHRDEESIQYRTFMYREPYQSCFVVQNGEETDRREPEQERRPSQAATTPHMGPKKKISLSEYRASKARHGGGITPASKKQSPPRDPAKPPPPQINGIKPAAKAEDDVKPAVTVKPVESKPHKQPPTEIPLPKKPAKGPDEPPKKSHAKTDQPNPTAPPDSAPPSNGTPHGLPPLLSPVQHPKDGPHGLPPIVSPTLPASILAAIAKEDELKRLKKLEPDASVKSSDKSGRPQAEPEPRPAKRVEEVAATSRVRSASVNGHSPIIATSDTKPGSPPQLLVKFKYGKRLTSRVQSLLKLPPNRKAQAAVERVEREKIQKDRISARSEANTGDGVARKKEASKTVPRPPQSSTSVSKPTPKVSEKRPRIEDDSSSINPPKRQKPSQDGLSTPRPRATSPALSTKSSAQKSQPAYATPKKDLKASNMSRTKSTESNAPTPGASTNTPSRKAAPTPSSVRHVDKGAPTSAPSSGKKNTDAAHMEAVSKEFNALGRILKHEIPNTNPNSLTKKQKQIAAITGLECILSYMAAFGAQDSSRPVPVEQSWKTLLPLAHSYRLHTASFPPLDGLRYYLFAITSAAICTQVSRAAAHSKAHDSPQNGNAPSATRTPSDNFALLSEHYKIMVQAMSDARLALPMEDIQSQYPKTWAGQERNLALVKAAEKNSILCSPYSLPISTDTTPLQAVQFGLKFLEEYVQAQGLEYQLRVSLAK